MGGLLRLRGGLGVDHDRVLELEQRIAMDKGAGIGWHAVVGAPPGAEVQLAELACRSALDEGLPQCGGGLGGGGRDRKNSDLAARYGGCAAGARAACPPPAFPTGSSAQKRRVSANDSCSTHAQGGSAPARTTSASSSRVASDSLPSSAPYTSREAGWSTSSAAVSFKLAYSSSGARGAHPCQASMRAAAWAGGQVRWKLVTCGAGTVPNSSEVTTPKLPAPAPRSPQNRSWLWCSSQSRTRPSASTTWAASSRSEVAP